jgi:esterase
MLVAQGSDQIPPRDHFVLLNGMSFRYRDWPNADAPIVLILHGFHQRAEFWDSVAHRLQEHSHVIVLDQRGHGLTEWAQDYQRELWVEDVIALIDALHLEQLAIVGHSMGGRHAWAVAARCPVRIGRLVIIDIGPTGTTPSTRPPPTVLKRLGSIPAWLRYNLLRPLRHRVQRALTHQRPDFDPRLRTPPARPEQEWEELRVIRCPTLLVRGTESDVLSHEGTLQMVEAMQDSRLVEIPQSGHMVHWDNEDALVETLTEFLSSEEEHKNAAT